MEQGSVHAKSGVKQRYLPLGEKFLAQNISVKIIEMETDTYDRTTDKNPVTASLLCSNIIAGSNSIAAIKIKRIESNAKIKSQCWYAYERVTDPTHSLSIFRAVLALTLTGYPISELSKSETLIGFGILCISTNTPKYNAKNGRESPIT